MDKNWGDSNLKKKKKFDLEYKIPTFFFVFGQMWRGLGTWIVIGRGGGGGAEDDIGALSAYIVYRIPTFWGF